MSIGVYSVVYVVIIIKEIFIIVDKVLYKVKSNGCNCVEVVV